MLRNVGSVEQVQLAWKGERYRLLRNLSHSGLPRYEDAGSALVWIDLEERAARWPQRQAALQ